MALRALTIGDTSYAGEPAPLLLGPKEFVEKMKKLLKGDRGTNRTEESQGGKR
jgi:hypothetical protein